MFANWGRPVIGALVAALAFLSNVLAFDECVNPDVRKEWRTLTTEEKTEWLDAIKCLMSLPHTDALTPSVPINDSQIPAVNASGSYYDDFVYVHMDLNTKIHFTGYFLPWHRWYVHAYDIALKQKCGYTGAQPYWNWSTDAHDVYSSPLFDPNVTSGLGTWGVPDNDYSVADGAFADKILAYPEPHVLRRNYTLQPYVNTSPPFTPDPQIYANVTFTNEQMQKLINGFVGDYKGFQAYFETFAGAHSSVHEIIVTLGAHVPSVLGLQSASRDRSGLLTNLFSGFTMVWSTKSTAIGRRRTSQTSGRSKADPYRQSPTGILIQNILTEGRPCSTQVPTSLRIICSRK